MKNLNKLVNECKADLNAIGIPYSSNIYQVKVNTRAKKRWGLCRKTAYGYQIEVSYRLMDDSVDDNATKDTIIHELLHTCDGCMNHGSRWQMYANKVNRAYSQYNIQTTTSCEEKQVAEMEPTYTIGCPCCGARWNYMRKTRAVSCPGAYQCGKCHEKLVRVK